MYKTAEDAYRAYIAQREINNKNEEFFREHSHWLASAITMGNIKRLESLREFYLQLRKVEINNSYNNQV